ncbi:hypothetical protein [Streptomyces sp. SID12501]|uniref:Uncharacterized protein n=1 Tax=Streptomyces sp. SID12501 TaxID=2706042 RepID=A0A6B3C0N0_9ACTN|nr:hypothetical protein [Streptomyces sp. SID12501]NEC90084.1 hypothetical protein [Streptomyces sp. SID12501]
MGREEYWVAIARDGLLRGAGFFVTRHFVVTLVGCVRELALGGEVELTTAGGLGLGGVVDEIVEDVGLALIHVIAPARADYPTPQADRAVKGDSWWAPYRPGPHHPPLRGTVDGVLPDCRRAGADRALSVLELTVGPLQMIGADFYAGGPVERRGSGMEDAVLGVLLETECARGLRGDRRDSLAAGDIGGVIDAFDALNPHRMLGLLREGVPEGPAQEPCLRLLQPLPSGLPVPVGQCELPESVDPAQLHGVPTSTGPARRPGPIESAEPPGPTGAPEPPDVSQRPWPPDAPTSGSRRAKVEAVADVVEFGLRKLQDWAAAGIVDPRDLPPHQIALLDEVVRAAKGEEMHG